MRRPSAWKSLSSRSTRSPISSMPLTHRLLEGQPLVIIRATGACTGSDVAHRLRALARDERLPAGVDTLWDGLRISHFSLLPEEVEAVREAQRTFEAHMGPGRTAVVVARPEDDLVARLFALSSEGTKRTIRIFGDLEAALTWLEAEGVVT